MEVGVVVTLISLLAVFSLIALAVYGVLTVSSSVTHKCPKCRKNFLTENDLTEHTKKEHRTHLSVVPEVHKAA